MPEPARDPEPTVPEFAAPVLPTVPVSLRVHLAHATVQAIADEADADVLHIKGPAVDRSLRPDGRASVDADVLVRPAHLGRLLAGLTRHGWAQVTKLRSGGLVEHSTNWYHPELGQLDVHVQFPGIQADAGRAFDVLWRDRGTPQIAHRACVAPGEDAQRLILLLHAACRDRRNRGHRRTSRRSVRPELCERRGPGAGCGRMEVQSPG